MKRSTLVKIAIAVAVLGALAYLGRNHYHELGRLRDAPPLLLAGMLGIYFIGRLLNGRVNQLGLRALGHMIGLYEAFMLVILTTYANLLLPRVGVGMPALYLKVKHQVSYANFASMAIVVTIAQIAAIGIVGLIVSALIQARTPVPPVVYVMFAGVVVGSAAMVFVRVPVPAHSSKVLTFLRRASEAWARMGQPRIALGLVLWNVPMLLLRGVRVQMSFYAVGHPVSYPAALIASLLGDLAFFISVTPSAIGIREVAMVYAGTIIGADAATSLRAAFLDRLVWSIGIVIVAQFGVWQLMRPIKALTPQTALATEPQTAPAPITGPPDTTRLPQPRACSAKQR